MIKKHKKHGPLIPILVATVILIVVGWVTLSTDALIDVGEVDRMAGNDVSIYSKSRSIKESQNLISGIFKSEDEEVLQEDVSTVDGGIVSEGVYEGESVDTTGSTASGASNSVASLIVNGDVIDFTGVVGSTIHTVSSTKGEWDVTVSGYRWDTMAWRAVTDESSQQYALRQKYYPNWVDEVPEAFDSNGIGIIEGRYVVAVTQMKVGGVGEVGMTLDVYMDNGAIIPCVVGDIKSPYTGEFWCPQGHFPTNSSSQINTIEFCISSAAVRQYSSAKEVLPELDGNIIKIVRGDNLLTGESVSASTGRGSDISKHKQKSTLI